MMSPGPTPSDFVDLAFQHLPDSPLLVGGLVGVGAVAVSGRLSGRLAARQWARRQAKREGYALPMHVRDDRNIDRAERMGSVVSIPDVGSILALGATRSGKTETGKWIVDGMQADENEPMVVYDHKEDYQQFFDEIGREYITLSASGSTHTWNIFAEIERESDADEIARAIFAEIEQAGGLSGAFFGPTARQIFAAVLKYLCREADEDANLSNESVVGFFREHGPKEAYEALCSDGKGDLAGIAAAINPDAGDTQQSGVWANVQKHVTDVFTSDFARAPTDERSSISICEYVEKPRGQGARPRLSLPGRQHDHADLPAVDRPRCPRGTRRRRSRELLRPRRGGPDSGPPAPRRTHERWRRPQHPGVHYLAVGGPTPSERR